MPHPSRIFDDEDKHVLGIASHLSVATEPKSRALAGLTVTGFQQAHRNPGSVQQIAHRKVLKLAEWKAADVQIPGMKRL